MQPFETVYVDTNVVACNGNGESVGGHPLVYLNLSADGKIECPYCSRLFVREKPASGQSVAAPPHP